MDLSQWDEAVLDGMDAIVNMDSDWSLSYSWYATDPTTGEVMGEVEELQFSRYTRVRDVLIAIDNMLPCPIPDFRGISFTKDDAAYVVCNQNNTFAPNTYIPMSQMLKMAYKA